MKKITLLVILTILIIFNFNYAQDMVAWENIANSAFTPYGEIVINIDAAQDTINMDSLTTKLFYSMDNQQSWTTVEMNSMSETGYEKTFSQTVDMVDADSVIYGFKAGYPAAVDTLSDSLYLTMSPESETGYFPPPENWLTQLCPESEDDAVNAMGKPFLELTDLQVSYSEDKFIFSLDNADNEWPFYDWIPAIPPWYVYAIGLKNPEDLDSTGYAIIYADIPDFGSFPGVGIGLYKGDLVDSSYSQIGTVNHTVDQGDLYLACNISDLTTDPDFGPWPNSSGSILTVTAVMTISIDGTEPSFTLNDNSHPTLFFPENVHDIANDTTLPQLSDLTYQTMADSFVFSITYTDAGNNLPTVRKLVSDNSEFSMHSSDHYYADGSEFSAVISIGEFNDGPVYAQFNDGINSVISNTLVIDNIDYTNASQNIKTKISPNPFWDNVNISFSFETRKNITNISDMKIYNLRGRLIKVIENKNNIKENVYEFSWDGSSKNNETVKSGIYFYKIEIDGTIKTEKLILFN